MGLRFETLRLTRGANEQWWRYGASGLAAWSYLWGSSAVSEETLRIVEQVRTRGVAVSHVDRLFPTRDAFSELRSHVGSLTDRSGHQIDRARERRGEILQVSLTGEHPTLELTDPVVRFLMTPELTAVAGHFYRMAPRLLECKVWQTIAADSTPVRTQRWHRDRPGDRHVLKCFVYLNDVTDGSGPFCFAPGTHLGGDVEPSQAAVLEGKVERFDDANVDDQLEVMRCTGPVGTVVFADTTGLHMGGRSVFGERLMITAQYASAAAWQRPYFDVTEPSAAESTVASAAATGSADRNTRYALGLDPPPRARHLRRNRRVGHDALT